MTEEIRTVELRRVLSQDDATGRIGDPAPEVTGEPIAGPVRLVDPDVGMIGALVGYPGEIAALRLALRDIVWDTTLRSRGIRYVSRTFGFSTRNVIMKREACRPCKLAQVAPESHARLAFAARALGQQFAEIAPEQFEAGFEAASAVLPEWRLDPDAPWTSGVVNKTTPLQYHRDRANFECWSAMPVLRRGVRGGFLHLPEYDAFLTCSDASVLYFDGNTYVHGVTPMRSVTPDAYRVSIVYYALKKMAQCLPAEEETARAQKVRTERESTVVARQRESGWLKEAGAEPEPEPVE